MKKKSVLFAPLWLCLCFLLLFFDVCKCQDTSSCFCFPQHWVPSGQSFWGNDKLAIDTCGIGMLHKTNSCDTLYWYFKMYPDSLTVLARERMRSKLNWMVMFKVDAIKLHWVPDGTGINAKWRDIDTAFPSIRAGFSYLENKFGDFRFRKRFPQDTIDFNKNSFYLEFNNWAPVLSVNRELKKIPDIESVFDGYPVIEATDIDNFINKEDCLIYPQPATDILYIDLDANIINCEILNLYGQSVLKKKIIKNNAEIATIDINALNSGIYFIIVNNFKMQFIKSR